MQSQATLRFAATHALSLTFVPAWLRALEARVTVAQIVLISDVLQQCEVLIMNANVQFLISHAHSKVSSRLDSEKFPSVQIGSDILLPVSAPSDDGRPLHTLQNRRDGSSVKILTYSPEFGIGRIVREVGDFALGRLRTRVVFTAHLASVLRNMAASGSGIAWLPQTLIADDLRSGSLIEAASGDWRISMEVRLYRHRGHMGKVGENLWDAVLASAATS